MVFGRTAAPGGLSMHLGGRAHASADAVQRFRAVRVGVGQTGEALAERFGLMASISPGVGRIARTCWANDDNDPLPDARVVEIEAAFDACELGRAAADVDERAPLYCAVAGGADEAQVRLVGSRQQRDGQARLPPRWPRRLPRSSRRCG